jgi:hypothetical protein
VDVLNTQSRWRELWAVLKTKSDSGTIWTQPKEDTSVLPLGGLHLGKQTSISNCLSPLLSGTK